VVDDDERFRRSVAKTLRTKGYRVASARDGSGAIRTVRRQAPDLVLLDANLPDTDGLEVLQEMKSLDPAIPAVMFTGYGSVEGAVDAMRRGAHDYLEKPIRPSRLLRVVERVVEQSRPPEFAQLGDRRPTLVGDSHGMRSLRRSIGQAARAIRTPVLIHGESGTGKELVARAIHDAGPGGKEPFIGINCAALTESLLESELFGYEKGAFTGAAPEGKQGLFAAARRGTLFLDEVGEMAPSLQAKLLRVLQERTLRPVGATADQAVSCRVVASTNRDLKRAVENGDFRQDLYYRLNVLTIEVPPLRERRADLQPLARFFLHRCLADLGKNLIGFSSEAERALQDHEWPGNVRELRNVIEHAVLVCPAGEIGVGHLGLGKTSIQPTVTRHLPIKSMKIREMERELIAVVLDETHGNISKAARTLGINRSTLYAKIKEYGLSSSKA